MSENEIRVCPKFDCPVLTYQTLTYPDKINKACPSCGRIGTKKSTL